MSRAGNIAALRRLVDLLEQCPNLPCPGDVFISVQGDNDTAAIEQMQTAEQQLAAAGVKARRESPLNQRQHHLIAFNLGDFVYEAFRIKQPDTREEAA